MPVVLSTGPICAEAIDLLAPYATVRIASDASAGTLVSECADTDVVIARDRLPVELFHQATRLTAVIRHGTGLDLIPVGRASAAGVLVANTPGLNAQSVAEHALLAMLMLARRAAALEREFWSAGWDRAREHSRDAIELQGATLGLVGTGAIGRAVARAVTGLGMRTLGTNTHPQNTPDGIIYAPLDDLLSASNVVVVCCPLTDRTRGLLNARRLARLPHGALLVHVGREEIIDLPALAAALRAEQLGGASLDLARADDAVTTTLASAPNVVLTPHTAAVTTSSMRRMGLGAARAARDVLCGRIPPHTVNLEAAYRFDHSRSSHCETP